MADPVQQIAEAVEAASAQAASVAAGVVAGAEAQIEGAVARAEAAEGLNEQLTEAALRGKLGERIDELEDEVDTCRETQNELTAALSQTRQELMTCQNLMTTLQAEVELLKPLLQPTLILQPSSDGTNNSTTITEKVISGPADPNNLPNVSEAAPQDQGQKTRRYRLT